jgi:arabinogalactan endo-1,4-beta-galactosidase
VEKSFKRTFWISRSKSISTQSKASWNESLAYRSLFRHMADPGVQTTPEEWKSLVFQILQVAVSNYTATILTEISPDIIQIEMKSIAECFGHKGI